MTRQGFEVEMADPTVVYSEGRTGLPICDARLATVNPHRLASASTAYTPDFRRPPRHDLAVKEPRRCR
ncbi:hypothetical protein [Streptomyces halobius]|uniref:Uncharacterized protein n=1 Tax=Streptomyces halobius TaxID=2879846 RepID=A0ABY4MEN1_9ACTN|nr:hypothetical protein [Streptomyces halobius]UQA94816.1 hypothetical protein K9S39_25795 [Streptomyces halobius]